MDPIVQSVIIWIITGLLGAAVGAAVSLLRVKSGKWMRKAVADR